MTTDKYCREQWRARYGTTQGQQQKGAFHHEYPKHVEVVIIDFMQFVKHINRDHTTMQHIIDEWVGIIQSFYRASVNCVILCFDRETPAVKSIHCHTKRYKGVRRFTAQDSPVLSSNMNAPLHLSEVDGPNWNRMPGILLQREVYPMLWNALINPDKFPLKEGHMLVLHGLPSKMQPVTVVHGAAWEEQFAYKDVVMKAVPWNMDDTFGSDWPISQTREDSDPDLYKRVFAIKGARGGSFIDEVPKWKNDIREADNAVFYYQHFDEFKYRHTMICINDGDAVSIAVLQSHDRLNEVSDFCNDQYICLKYHESKANREKREKDPFQKGKGPPKWEYCDVNKLHCMLDKDPAFVGPQVSNPQLTFVMLNILAGSDFFTDYCKGIGKKFIWSTFFQSASLFSHLVQWHICSLEPDPTAFRRAIVDETLFEQFTYYIYINKYGKGVRKKNKGKLDFSILESHCSSLQKQHCQMPDERACKMFARQLGWNIQYWLNAARNIYVDPFEKWRNMPYWGYKKNAETHQPEVSYIFSPKQKPYDESYKRNMLKRKRKMPQPPPRLDEGAKKRVVRVMKEEK